VTGGLTSCGLPATAQWYNRYSLKLRVPGSAGLPDRPATSDSQRTLPRASTNCANGSNGLRHTQNRKVLPESYGIPAEWRRNRALRPQYWLIYGRREENPEEIARLRDYYGQKGPNVHAYDNLRRPNEWCKDYITVRPRGGGTYQATFVPPTASWIAASPESWRVVKGRREAVLASPGISDDRRSYLIDQIPEWDAWATYWLERRELPE
jgi:hypothetical protein